jgi:hypothetical protein
MQIVSVRGAGVGSGVSVSKGGFAVLVEVGNAADIEVEIGSGVTTAGVCAGPQDASRNPKSTTIPYRRRRR